MFSTRKRRLLVILSVLVLSALMIPVIAPMLLKAPSPGVPSVPGKIVGLAGLEFFIVGDGGVVDELFDYLSALGAKVERLGV